MVVDNLNNDSSVTTTTNDNGDFIVPDEDKNTGQRDANAAIYQFTLDSGLSLVSETASGVLGTIDTDNFY